MRLRGKLVTDAGRRVVRPEGSLSGHGQIRALRISHRARSPSRRRRDRVSKAEHFPM